MTTKKYLTTPEEILALKDTNTKIYNDNVTGVYYQFIGGVLCSIHSNSTPIFNVCIDVNGNYYIFVEEPVKDATEEDIGKLGWFYDDDDDDGFIDILKRIDDEVSDKYIGEYDSAGYRHLRLLTPEEVEKFTGYKVIMEK